MTHGDVQRRKADLRLAAAVAEIEGLHTALLKTTTPGRRRPLRAELFRAAERLAVLAAVPGRERQGRGASRVRPRRSRRDRRKALAERGAAWLIARHGRDAG
ncbi:hypothetical protein BIV25_21730 [Streptomyces sp. MUSC 14]|uniref:hypothetical protein n=1 Tax=Streptomyces sp. MUSC 14 TaxID=1354889 RepID=UPI0008F58B69|nr:hypothetical protein [Streptomyces sp. MUSC 14]OIJ94701.1 hypothetical protein BIV25_21730 [Streptomyces sp. MUSC 14]